MFTPFSLRGLELPNRVVVSAMDMYSAVDGTVGDFHLVHLGARALGGAGLVMTEMICVSPEGRITPGCAGIYRAEHVGRVEADRRLRPRHGGCAIGAQIGHSGRKGSTKLMWDGIDEPLEHGNWPVIGPSALRLRSEQPGPARDDAWRTWRSCWRSSSPRSVAPSPPDSTCSSCTARTAICSRVPLAARRTPSHRLVRRVAGGAGAVPARGVRRLPRGVAGGQADERSDLRNRLGRGRLRRRRRSRVRADAASSTAATSSTSPPVRSRRSSARRSAAATRPRSPTGSATRSGSRRSPSARSPRYDDVNTIIARRAAPTCARSAGPTSTTRTGRCTRPRNRSYDGVPWVPFSISPDRASRRAAGRRVRKELERTFEPARARGTALVVPEPRPWLGAASAAGYEPLQPQDLVITLLGTYVRPFGTRVWSGGLVELLGEFGFCRWRRAGRADSARPPRADRARALRPARPLPTHGALRPAARRGRRADLLARRSPRALRLRRRGRCCGTRSPSTGASSAAGSRAGCGSSGSDPSRTACGCRPTTTRPRSARCSRSSRYLPQRRVHRAGRILHGLAAMVDRAWDLSGLVERYDAFVSGVLAVPRSAVYGWTTARRSSSGRG